METIEKTRAVYQEEAQAMLSHVTCVCSVPGDNREDEGCIPGGGTSNVISGQPGEGTDTSYKEEVGRERGKCELLFSPLLLCNILWEEYIGSNSNLLKVLVS